MTLDITKLSKKQIRSLKDAGVLEEMIGGQKDVTTPPYIRPVYDATYNQPTDGGIFTPPGVRPEMFSALPQPTGLTSIIQPVPSVYAQERIAILTGQLATVGTNPNDYCGPAVTPGDLKTCDSWYNWGEIHIASQKLNINSAGELANRAVQPRVILNRAVNDPFIPSLLQDPNINFMSPEAQAMYQAGTALRRALTPVIFSGNPATVPASATPGFIKEFAGLNLLIVTGHTDMESGNPCPAADSTIVNWNADISGTVGGQNITQQITALFYGRQVLAQQVGMETATWAIVMHPDLFYALTSVYACQYATYRCLSVNAGQPIIQQAPDINGLRLGMIRGSYLLIEGQAIPVIQDNAAAIGTTFGGNYRTADIYMMPLTFEGRPLIHFEFFPMDNEWQNQLAGHFNSQSFVSNNGMYRMYWDRSTSCVQMTVDAKMRMWVEAPFLCARLQNCAYISNINYRSPFPGVTGYVNGGNISYNVNTHQP